MDSVERARVTSESSGNELSQECVWSYLEDRWTNEQICRQCGVEVDAIGTVKRNILRWFGHMERMEDERLTKRVYRSEVGRVGRLGRPRIRWSVGVE